MKKLNIPETCCGILVLLIVACFFSELHAQELKGWVRNAAGDGVEDVYVFHLSSGIHTHTRRNGYFTLPAVKAGEALLFTHIRYESQTRMVQNPELDLEVVLEEANIQLEDVVVSPGVRAINLFSDIDLQTSPVKSSQEILRKVPGLIIGQHAGGGKAEQIFLRGFDIDHGTDVSIKVDGMPVNMVSHAHGQGYADLHFLIPETVDRLEFGKGPYYANEGNFATAGYVHFQTKDALQESTLQFEGGQFGTFRSLAMLDLLHTDQQSAYIASEYILSDGPFDAAQNFNRLNLMAKYTFSPNESDRISFLASHFQSQWDASGQIPQRAVDAGLISRFGAIDDTEGGNTRRTNFKLDYHKFINHKTSLHNSVFYNLYGFELFSNFTFFLNDTINGDQIRQVEQRQLFGAQSELNHTFQMGSFEGLLKTGVGLRKDLSTGNELARTLNRKTTLSTIQSGDIDETNLYAYAHTELEFGKWLFNPGIRVDFFRFQYTDALQTLYDPLVAEKPLVSPKLNLLYNYSPKVQVYLKSGIGFHSNDTRVSVVRNGEEVLPAAYGSDLGIIWKPGRNLFVNTALWYLFLEQEFVYVGDEGIVEPSGKTRRLGIDISVRYQLNSWLYFNGDINYAYARSQEESEGNNYIPLAPDLTALGGIRWNHPQGIYGGVTTRYIKDRPANEDNSIVAKGYLVTDANLGYQWKSMDLSLNVENVFNTAWNETQFATESRLRDEAASVEEIHFTPGTPFFLRGVVKYRF